MPLDIFQTSQRASQSPTENPSGAFLPATFENAFDTSMDLYDKFSASNAYENSRIAAMRDYSDSVYKRTGQRILFPDLDEMNKSVTELQKTYPDLQTMSRDDIDKAAVQKAVDARSAYAGMMQREQSFASWSGRQLGGLLAGTKDPMNIGAMLVPAGSAAGWLATAGIGAGTFAGAQFGSEVLQGGFRERVQPGYQQSGEPVFNILGAAASGAGLSLGGKAAGAVWSRVKTGQWPREIRDAGNVQESANQVADTNILAGAEGAAVHQENLVKATDQILRGDPVDVSVPPDVLWRSRRLQAELEQRAGFSISKIDEEPIRLLSEQAGHEDRVSAIEQQLKDMPAGNAQSAERLARLDQVERELAEAKTAAERKPIAERRDQLLADTTPEKLAAEAAPIAERRRLEAEHASIQDRLKQIPDELAKIKAETLAEKPAMIGERRVVPWDTKEPLPHWMAEAMGPRAAQAVSSENIAKVAGSPEQVKALIHDVEMRIAGPEKPLLNKPHRVIKPTDKHLADLEAGKATSATMQAAQAVRTNGGMKSLEELKDFAGAAAQIERGPEFHKKMQALIDQYSPKREKLMIPDENGVKKPVEAELQKVKDMMEAADQLERCMKPQADQMAEAQ